LSGLLLRYLDADALTNKRKRDSGCSRLICPGTISLETPNRHSPSGRVQSVFCFGRGEIRGGAIPAWIDQNLSNKRFNKTFNSTNTILLHYPDSFRADHCDIDFSAKEVDIFTAFDTKADTQR